MNIPKKKLSDGNEIPVLGLGTWQMEEEALLKAIPIAFELGYRHIDTAFAYYNEKFIGKAIADLPREQLFITTKLWRDFHDPKRVEEGCNQSLKDLGTSYVDLFLIHWPEKKNMVDVLEEMHRLKEKGKVKSVGVCNATEKHLEELVGKKVPIVVNQVEFHPFLNQEDLAMYCRNHQIAITAYCPIAQGKVFKENVLVEIGEKHHKTPAQVSLRWLLQKDFIVIPKGSSESHLRENITVFDFELSRDDMAKIDKLHRGHRIVNPDFNEFE